MEQRRSASVQSVERAFEILEVISAHDGRLTLSQLSAETALPAATVHRLLRTLVSRGYVTQVRNRSYELGEQLIPLGEVAARTCGSRRSRAR